MIQSKKLLQLSTSAALLAALVLPQAAAAAGQANTVPAATLTLAKPSTTGSAEWSSFVKQQYGIQLSGTVTREQFSVALNKLVANISSISEKDAAAKGFLAAGNSPLAVSEAISAVVKAADLKELAYTYNDEKVSAVLKQAAITYTKGGSISAQNAQELAVAIDTGFVSSGQLKEAKVTGAVSADLAYQLLGKVAEFSGHYKNYLGTVGEDGIYGKLAQAWYESQIIKAGELQQVVDTALKQNLVTGYNLKDATFDPHFDPARTITYGHSDIIHAIQLIGLLKSEGIDAKVQFEPKTSAFIYLKEWGEPVQTDDYQVVQIENGNYIAYAKEYDLSFEFASVDEKKRFQPLILKYAKKDSEDAVGLLKGSWWQPLYHSRTELADYPVITNNLLKEGRFIVQSFSLNDQSAKVVEGFKKLDNKVDIESYQFWVDQPFYNYLLGEYK
ncbi:hypothetical protein AN963_24490 [Brevibacillus choshinensis]|uniref:SLH domain-containing protein n=1 Tax=Brevibacillus choshinensis TaxID=54911 RepID=A0ABR5N226_BRECH|nr:hypothetical protein [Brevibacillus choshinensis]KQL44554.1 hypothetical protein AN963_24490 [Brevibacillus choshinensis]